MTDCEVWDIIKVPFPYTIRPIRRRRPALVIARHSAAETPLLLWVLMITSAAHRRWPGDVDLSNLTQAGLPAPSIVRSAKIATIEATDAEITGRLCAADRQAVAGLLRAALREASNGLDAPREI